MNRLRFASIAIALSVVLPATAQQVRDQPDGVIRSLVVAIYSNDLASYEKLTLPHPLRSRLTSGGRVNEDGLRELKDDPGGLQIRQTRPLAFQGKPAVLGPNGQFPVGTTGRYVVSHHRGPMIVGLVRRAEGWKVDLRWWIAMTDLMSGKEPAPNSPEFAIRTLLMSMLRLDRAGARALITDARDLDVLFDGAPRQREPSGVLEASAMEMPLVEVAPGEFFPMPSGRIVEGTDSKDQKVLVGWFGPVEIPFVLRRSGAGWKVEAEPYFEMLLQ